MLIHWAWKYCSVTFGVKKQLQAEEGMDEMEREVRELTEEKEALENEVMALQNRYVLLHKIHSNRIEHIQKIMI